MTIQRVAVLALALFAPAYSSVVLNATFGSPSLNLGSTAVSLAAPGAFTATNGLNFTLLSLQSNGVAGFKIFGTASITFNTTVNTPVNLILTASGTGSGSFPTSSIPFGYDFTVTDPNQGSPLSWTIGMSINGVSNALALSGLATPGVSTSGTGAILTPSGSALSTYSLALQLILPSVTSGETLTVTVPNHSLDVNPAPEPGSLMLVGSAAVAGLMLRRRTSR